MGVGYSGAQDSRWGSKHQGQDCSAGQSDSSPGSRLAMGFAQLLGGRLASFMGVLCGVTPRYLGQIGPLGLAT